MAPLPPTMPSTASSEPKAPESAPTEGPLRAVGGRMSRLRRRAESGVTWLQRPLAGVILSVAAWSLALQLVAYLGTTFLSTEAHPGQAGLTAAWNHWDARWYERIVAHGYTADLQPPESPVAYLRTAFYPGYPLLARGVYEVLHPLGIGVTGAMLATNQLLVFVMAVLLYLLATALTQSKEIGQRTVQALLLFPFSYFLLAPYTETAFLTLVAGFAWALTTRRYLVAAAFAAAAGATRPVGIVLSAILAIGYLEHHRWRLRSLRLRPLLYIGMSLTGFVGYALYQWKDFGDPLYGAHIEKVGWPARGFTLNLWHVLVEVFQPQPLTAGPFANLTVEILTMIPLLLLFSALSWIVWRRFGAAMGLMCALFILATLSSGSTFSFNRYVLPLLPAFVILGGWTRWRTFDFVYKTLGATLLALFLVLFTHGVWTG
jgi:hypothetical protein